MLGVFLLKVYPNTMKIFGRALKVADVPGVQNTGDAYVAVKY